MSTRTLASTLVALALFASLAAQSDQPAQSTLPAVTVDGATPTESTATRDRDTLSVDFPDEDIRTILRNVADLFELNLVIPDTLTGKTSIKLRDVTWRQIFQVVLSPAGYTFVEEGNIVKVVSLESLTMEPVSTEVFILNNAKAIDIKPTIEGLVDPAAGGKILIDTRSNALIVTERPSRMTRMRQIIEQLDKATAQVMIESQFVEVSDSDIRDLGVTWSSLATYQVGLQPTDTVVVHNARRVHVDGTSGTGVPRNNDGELISQVADASTTFSAVFSAPQFNVVLSALSQRSDTKVVSNPTIVTLNNTEATINIGSEFPIPSYTYNSERGTFEVSGFQYKPIGVLLKVTPQVNNEGTIRLLLEPEISSSDRQTSFGGAGGATIPIIDTRKVRTQISLKDGYTAGIGGLLTTTTTKGGSKVPVLGSIPGLGRLFSSKNSSERTTNLLIFITAKTVNPDGAAPSEVFSQAMLDAASSSPGKPEKK